MNLKGELECFDCGNVFESVMDRILHTLDTHNLSSDLYKCSNCQCGFVKEQKALDHASFCSTLSKRNKNTKDHKGLFCCDLDFKTDLSFWTHKFIRHKEMTIACPVCRSEAFGNNYANFRRHFLMCHCDYTFQCCYCPVVFEGQEGCGEKMINHIKIQHGLTRPKPGGPSLRPRRVIKKVTSPKAAVSSKTGKKNYVSKLYSRSLRSEPLSDMEYFKSNLNMSLNPPQYPSKVCTVDNLKLLTSGWQTPNMARELE